MAAVWSSRAWTRKTQPTLTPSRSAIQQASRAGVEAVDEVGGDARDERLEAHVPAVLARIERAVALDDPADVAARGGRSSQARRARERSPRSASISVIARSSVR